MNSTRVSSKLLLVALLVILGASSGCETKTVEQKPSTEDNAAVEEESEEPSQEGEAAEQGAVEQVPPEEVSTIAGDGDLVGRVSRQMIEAQREDWKKAVAEASPDEETAKALADVESGATITIYFGAWCEDCRRELPRFFRALDIAENAPFDYELIGLDKYFRADEVSEEPLDLPAIPTFVVERDGKEVGRVVEKSPEGIERDLLELLRGEKSGKVSATR